MSYNSKSSNDTGYVDVHGREINVVVCEKTGRFLIPMDEVKNTGFMFFRKSHYNKLLVDESQFKQEFDLFMLGSAKAYLLENKIRFNEDEILASINKVKQRLLSSDGTPQNDFFKNHRISEAADNISITMNLREPSALTVQNLHKHDKSPTAVNLSNAQNNFRESLTLRQNQHNDHRSNNVPSDKNNVPNRKFSGRDSFDGNRFSISSGRKNFQQNRSFNQKSPNTSFEEKPSSNQYLERSASVDLKNARISGDNNLTQNGEMDKSTSIEQGLELKLESIKLENTEHTVLVTHIEKPNLCWVQDLNNVDVFLNITEKIQTEGVRSHIVKKCVLNKIYLASYEDMWFRCKIIKFKPFTVFFVDYGNIAEVREVKEASEEVSKVLCQAVKITCNDSEFKPEINQSLKIRINQFSRSTYAVHIVRHETELQKPKVPEVSQIKTFFTVPEALCRLEHGQRVMIASQIDGQLAVRTKECYDKLRHIEKKLEEVNVKPVQSVTKGQLVLYNHGDKLSRAVVIDVQGNTIDLEFLDHYEKVKVDMSCISHMPEILASEPISYIVTPKIKGYTTDSVKIIEKYITSKAKMTVVLEKDNFDLEFGSDLVSSKLNLQNQDPDRSMLAKFTWYRPKLGIDQYMLNSYKDTSNLTFAKSEILDKYIEAIIKSDMKDHEPYTPIVGEVCFGSYQDSWSRCVVLSHQNFRYEVQFIDFGNIEFITSDKLRKLTADVMDAPIIAIPCKLVGLPTVKNYEELVLQNIVEGESYEINIKRFNEGVYEIEIPAIYKTLKSY